MTDVQHKHTNALINESSPYLLQHAHNPVSWHSWNDKSLQKAKDENKLLLISIGYSACHWCHVMEHESFEDEATASIMNNNFVCIKVDREERPDIDQVYMLAVQLMSGRGGWPLNCIALPDGRPIFGGTYFPKKNWQETLLKIAEFYNRDPAKCIEYADELAAGIRNAGLISIKESDSAFTKNDIDETYNNWTKHFDNIEGGPNRAPKFPLPNNYKFLLRYHYHTGNQNCLDHVLLTLRKMAYGGIYDQLGGGFARYSTDGLWKVPHFEKMLYDNAQLVSLYSSAYQLTKENLSKEIVYETLEFIKREMTSPEGSFYSALDADSEGEEGKYYVWEKDELQNILGNKSQLFCEYYNVNETGYWEHNNYILLRKKTDNIIAVENNITTYELNNIISECKNQLLREREKRIKPGLDDKQLTSWNALMLKGYIDAYTVFGNKEFLDTAIKNANFILEKCINKSGELNHSYKNGKSSINGFLEDYCFTIEAFIKLYEATGEITWLDESQRLTSYVINHFYDEQSGLFYFTSDEDPLIITRKFELDDNVIPASNSCMAKNLFLLGHYLAKIDYTDMSKKMLLHVKENMIRYGSGYSNWGMVIMNFVFPFYEIAIAGTDAKKKVREINQHFLPNKIMAWSERKNHSSLLQNRFEENDTLIYLCEENHCLAPEKEASKTLLNIRKNN